MDNKKIFVIHGRNEKIRRSMFDFLRAVGLDPQEWGTLKSNTGTGAPFIGEILDAAFRDASGVLALFTPDDEAKLRDEFIKADDGETERKLTPQARPNVIFEAGMAMGSHPKKTIFVEMGRMRPFSDISGRHIVRLTNDAASRMELVHALKAIGMDVDIEGKTDYLKTGDFTLLESSNKPVDTPADSQETTTEKQKSSSLPRIQKLDELPFKIDLHQEGILLNAINTHCLAVFLPQN